MMKNCHLCSKCIKLLKHWNIKYRSTYDYPEQARLYPYITIELEYEEVVDWIAREILK
jgi:hypothetical protein